MLEKTGSGAGFGGLFDVAGRHMPKKGWWWSWLFFFDNPDNPAKPRQLMVLWSLGDVFDVECNGLVIKHRMSPSGGAGSDSLVAAWYYDGGEMRHSLLFERCGVELSGDMLYAGGTTPSSFSVFGSQGEIKIGGRFRFLASSDMDDSGFFTPSSHSIGGFLGVRGTGYPG